MLREVTFFAAADEPGAAGGKSGGLVMKSPVPGAIWRSAAAAGSGVLLAAAFPPFDGPEAAWVGLVPLLILAGTTRPLRAFRWGCFSGLVFWLISISWLLRLGTAGGPWVAVVAGWVLLSGYCALYTGVFTACVAGLWGWGARGAVLVPATALLWVGAEYLRSTLFTGFAWNALGISQFRHTAVLQIAAWGGVYAVSALVVVVNAAAASMTLRLWAILRRQRVARFQVELALGLVACACAMLWGRSEQRRTLLKAVQGEQIRIAAVQPNVAQNMKWDEGAVAEIYEKLERLTRHALLTGNDLDLIVWPETAVPDPLPGSRNAMAFIRQLAEGGSPVLVGAMEVRGSGGWGQAGTRYYNSSFLFDRFGRLSGIYRKKHLVLFGEYVPLDKVFPPLQKLVPIGVSCSAGSTSTVFRLPAHEAGFSTMICFEDTVAPLAREAVRKGAQFLVNQTNDAWFDGSGAPVQHLAHCVFRCVENRVPAVRAANSGVSCFISAAGTIQDAQGLADREWDLGVSAVKVSGLRVAPAGVRTFYTRYGDLPFALPAGVMSAAFFVLVLGREKRKNPEGAPGEATRSG